MRDKILHLTLNKKWFDMFLSGDKKEEYREIKSYWIKRLCYFNNDIESFDEMLGDIYNNLAKHKDIDEFVKYYDFGFVNYTHIIFTNGYGKNRPNFKVPIKDITISNGVEIWGGSPLKLYFVIKTGEIINDL